jgi:hypothetical protein
MAAIGLGQVRDGGAVEPPMITSGDSVTELAAIAQGRTSYPASDVLRFLLGEPAGAGAAASIQGRWETADEA